MIIRGGENVPVFEIEALRYKHPAIAQVAVVALPDERLGERGCAVVVPRAGQSVALADRVGFLKDQKVALQPARPTSPSTWASPTPAWTSGSASGRPTAHRPRSRRA